MGITSKISDVLTYLDFVILSIGFNKKSKVLINDRDGLGKRFDLLQRKLV